MHAPVHKLPVLQPQRSRTRRERRSEAARVPVLHAVMPSCEVARAVPKPRETVTAFLRRTGWAVRDRKYGWQFKRGLPTVLEINGAPVLRKFWRTTRIAANDNARFTSFPLGGGSSGGKQIAGLVALVAVAAFAIWAGPAAVAALIPFGTAVGAGATITAGLITAGIGIGGSLLINALTAPKAGATNDPNAKQDQIYSVGAQGNTAKLGQPLPIWYGRLKTFPDFAATPWGEFVGNNQFLNVLLSVTMGSLEYENLFIGDTILWDQSTGVSADFPGAQVAFYEPGEPVTLFPVNVDSSTDVTGQQLPDGSGSSNPVNGSPGVPGAPLGPFAANPPSTQAQSIAVDFVLPAGCYILNASDAQQVAHPTPVRLIAEYAPINNAGATTGAFITLFDVTKSYASKSPIRDSIKVDVTPGRYTVRLKRGDESLTSPQGTSVVVWAGLRSFLKGDNSFPDVSTIALRLLAAQSTQGSYKFGVLATRKLPVWSGSAFVTQATRNNGWAFLDAVTNSQYGSTLPLSKVDFNAVVNFAAGCDARGDSFDYKFDSAVSVPEALDKILTPARARHFWLGDTVSIVRDEWRDVPSMLLTDREIVRDSTQVTWTMLGDEDPDAVIVEYIDQETWLPAQVQYPPNDMDFTAVNAEVKRIDGIVDRDQAFREAAFYYLQSIYRRENVQIGCEYEGRAITFGSVLRVQSELPMAYGYGGAVVGVSGHALTLDPAPVWDTGPFYIRLRRPNGKYFGPVAATEGVSAAIANLDATGLAAAEAAQSTTLAAVLAREDGGEYPSFELGSGDSQSKLCVVLSGVPNGNLCTLNLVVDDERVHATDLGDPPILPTPQFPADAKVPLIVGLNATFGQGIAEPKLAASWFPAAGAFYYIADVSYDSGVSWQQVYEGQDNSFDKVVTLAALRLRVQAVSAFHGPYSTVDVTAPTIEISSNTVALNSLIDGLKFQVTTALDRLNDTRAQIEQLIGSIASIDIARNWLDKQSLRRELVSISDAANARITEVFSVATNTEAALAQTRLDLVAGLGAANSRITITNTALSDLTQSFADQTSSFNSQFGTVSGQITTEIQTRSTADGALSLRIDSFSAQTNNSFASVNQVLGAHADQIGALSFQQSNFSTTLNGHTSQLNLLASSLNGVSLQFGVTGTIDGVTGGFVLTGVHRLDGGAQFNLLIDADVSVLGTFSGSKIRTGTLDVVSLKAGQIDSHYIAQDGVSLDNLIAGAATDTKNVPFVAGGPTSGLTTVVTTPPIMNKSGKARVDFCVEIFGSNSGAGADFATYTLYVDGVAARDWRQSLGGISLATSARYDQWDPSWDCVVTPNFAHVYRVDKIANGTVSASWGPGILRITDLRR